MGGDAQASPASKEVSLILSLFANVTEIIYYRRRWRPQNVQGGYLTCLMENFKILRQNILVVLTVIFLTLEVTAMMRQFEVRCEKEIWTVRRDGMIYGEHEEQCEAIEQAEKLSRRYKTRFVLYDNEGAA